MATTTIPWNDGSGDNIYVSAPSQDGSQEVLVSSDENKGSVDRTQTVSFMATANGQTVVKILTITQEKVAEQYIVFADPLVEQICASTWGDGVGLKPSQAAAVTSVGTYFRGKAITSFEEFGTYFTSLTTIPANAFNGCSSLSAITIPSSVTSAGNSAFEGCSSIINLEMPIGYSSSNNYVYNSCGNGTGTFILHGDYSAGSNNRRFPNFKHIVVYGNLAAASTIVGATSPNLVSLRVSGNYTSNTSGGLMNNSKTVLDFIEVKGTVTGRMLYNSNSGAIASGAIIHLGYSGVACAPSVIWGSNSNVRNRISKIYVGPGESQEGDEAILSQYTSDGNWSSYSSKLATWWSYSGDYK